MTFLEQFSVLSGYKINIHKSEYFPPNPAAESLALTSFRKALEGFRYLRIFVTKTVTQHFAKNVQSFLERCITDLARWSSILLLHTLYPSFTITPQV